MEVRVVSNPTLPVGPVRPQEGNDDGGAAAGLVWTFPIRVKMISQGGGSGEW